MAKDQEESFISWKKQRRLEVVEESLNGMLDQQANDRRGRETKTEVGEPKKGWLRKLIRRIEK